MSGGPELEALIDAAVTAAELESGVPPSIAVSRSRLNPAEIDTSLDEAQAAGLARSNLGRWTPEEEAFVRDRLGKMSLEAIATAIGRTEAAVKVRFTRKGWAAPSKRQGELVARDVAHRLGKCGKAIKALIERGVLPGRVIPGKRGIHVVRQVTFYRWAVNPENWIYFNPGRVRDAKLSRLIELKRRRWGDEWLTTGQVARLRGLPGGSNDVTRQIYAGKLPAVKYQFWRVRRSAAEAHRFPEGRGSAAGLEWSESADAFLVLCAAVGVPQKTIVGLMKWPRWRPGYRLGLLRDEGRLESIAEQSGGKIWTRRSSAGEVLLFADWRSAMDRFRGLRRAALRLRRGHKLSSEDLRWLRGVLRAWAAWHAGDDPDGRRVVGCLRSPGRDGEARLRKMWREVQGWGVDPFDVDEGDERSVGDIGKIRS